ncbi:Polyketide synthase module protein [Pyrenophora tritici-repentis]|nr:Polyketide synthase module protein [Pyrenophora tritici-repentis]KAI0582076.1 Polyketide synthase module protein [Pyrenophora tritici-repentis]KAI1526926.1 Polyketide synthase module [Pyrenophora tritici-repentis]KAI1567224.1 Polyketide synthase module [Pyrenophora tritici-repentis]KAI2476082.1 Polyketide synthase module protein [Pyrenophora tritici-repentis]
MSPTPTPIAIIGIGCRLPGGVSDLDSLWKLLLEGRSGRMKIPKDRWSAEEWFDAYPDAKQSMVTKHGFFLQDDISQFDAKFFGISSMEAHAMDPQQRLLLMMAYEALEDACIPIDKLRGSNTGVFASIFERSYDRMGHKDLSTISNTHMNGTGEAILSNRISYCFDLKGPCMTIDTGCSGSLVALHQACHSLSLGESDLALVGGSQLVMHPDALTIMSGMGMLNPDGKSYAFDSRGEGYGRGEGVAMIVLKRLDRALEDGDRVHAIVANSGTNQDGKTSGLNTPSGDAQATLCSRVYREAGLNPADTSFVEAHGTGTQVGDREEIASIYKVFCESVARTGDLYVGSIKPNVGHLEATSGIAGLLKSILVLKHGQIPPNLDFIKPKPSLKLYERNIKIPTELTKLPTLRNGGPVRVSLNSFGYGGTNCHVILEAPHSESMIHGSNGIKLNSVEANGSHYNGVESNINSINGTTTNGTRLNQGESVKNGLSGTAQALHSGNSFSANTKLDCPRLIVLSAATENALSLRARDLHSWIKTHKMTPQTLPSLSYTLGVHRSALPYRKALVVSAIEELAVELGLLGPAKRMVSQAPVTFVFSGQGAQWHAMGLELINLSHVFRQSMSAMEDVLRQQGCQWSLVEELSRPLKQSRVGEAEIAQPATTAIQIALVDLLENFSIRPSRVVGHSSGEIAAAYAAGALSCNSAILLAYHRGVFSAKAKKVADVPGSMMAVSLNEIEAMQHLKKLTRGTAVVACVNSSSSLTLSGDETALDELKEVLDKDDIFARKLRVDTAYHSHHMQCVAEEYQEAIGSIESSNVRDEVTFYSSVTGAIKSTGFGADYWTSNLVSQVKFSQALTMVRDDQIKHNTKGDVSVFVEIGPHSALAGPSRQILMQEGAEKFKFEYLSALLRNVNAAQSTLALVGRLFELGLEVKMAAVLTMTNKRKPEIIRDLRPYPWDLAPFWRESRLSKAHRFRQFPHHDLLGLFDPASTIHEPRWRYFINMDTLPWLRGHMVEGFTIYPGAGYLTMAMEAMKQLVQMRGIEQPIAKFVLRNVTISKAIVLSEPDDTSSGEVEVQLSMSAANQYEGSRWESFRIRSYNVDGSWSIHCSGEITVEHDMTEPDEVEGTRERELRQDEALQFLTASQQSCDAEMTKSEFYNFARLTGNEFSGAFTAIVWARYGKNRGVFEICTPDVAPLMPYRSFRHHIIHPTTLDATQQINAVLFKKFITNAACVPTSIPLLEISASLSTTAGNSLTGAIQIEADGPKASKGEGWVFQKDTNGHLSPVIRLLVNLRAIGDTREEENRPFVQDVVNRLDWNLDADFMTGTSFLQELSSKLGLDENTTHGFEGTKISVDESQKEYLVTDQASSIWFREAVRHVEEDKAGMITPQQVKFFGWMKRWLASDYCRQITSGLTREEETSILKRIELCNTSAQLQLLARVGKALPHIVTGETQPLDVMLEGNLLSRYYESGILVGPYEAAVAYMKILTFKNPRLRVLEIGAGTGGCTKWLFRGLSGQNGAAGLPFEEYTFTDVSSGFFEDARQTFAEWEDIMQFRTLDADQDPLEQGFEPGSYDVVVAANVLHATRKIDVTISRVRKLLKPGGSLLLLEIPPRGAAFGLVAGPLTGWWAPEDDFRVDSPLLFRNQWQDVLARNGFGGIHLAWECMMVAKADPELCNLNREHATHSVVLIGNGVDDHVERTTTEFASRNIDTIAYSWEQAKAQEGSLYVILDIAEERALLDPKPPLFETIKAIVSAKTQVLWVLLHNKGDPAALAYKGLVNAFVRVLRRESGNTSLVTLDIRHPAQNTEQTARTVADVACRRFWPARGDLPSLEPEFACEDGRVLIPRVRADVEFLKWARRGTESGADIETEPAPYQQSDRVLKAEVATPGLLSSLRFVDDHISTALEPCQIEVKAEAHGVNYKDVGIALGQKGPGVHMAGEFAGVVTAVGEDMRHLYELGDRVMGFGAHPYSNLLRVHGYQAHKTPISMSATTAASIPHAYVTAFHCIVEIARLERGQSILIHAASGGVGQAAIQLAQHIGANIFCTVSTATKKKLIMDEYAIPESHVFSSQTGSLKQGIMRLTDDEGVDLVLNSSVGEMLRDSLDCVKTLGTFIELGKSEMQQGPQLSMASFNRSITFNAFDLETLAARNPKRVQRIMGDIVSLIESNTVHPARPISTYSIGQIEDAFRLISSRKHTGKVVLQIEPASTVKCLPAKPLPLHVRKDGTYIAAGGLGDLTSRICVFLASRGAGHIVSLSRRTVDDATKQKYMATVEKHGCKLHILQCDITNDESIKNAVDYCSTLPPVRGVVNGTLVLRDRTFAQMTVEEWKLPLQPKVLGTLNLDKFFASSDLAFFMTLSSVVAVVGKAGQSNYAAGNGFQDAFARAHANHPHTHYVSVNVGAVSVDAHGALKESQQGDMSIGGMKASLRQNSVMDISFDEFLANIEYAINSLIRGHDIHQTIQGVTHQSMVDANDEHLLENPIFSQLSSQKKKITSDTQNEKIDLKKSLGCVKTMEEAEQLIQAATLNKFAVFLDRPIDQIRVDQSLATIGLDSLVSIELKNWMVRTFQVNLQTSELGGAGSIQALAVTVASRSKLIPDDIRPPRQQEATTLVEKEEIPMNVHSRQNHSFYCCRASKELPRHPLVNLDEAVNDLLSSIGHFSHTREEHAELTRKAHALAVPGSLGRKLYNQLRAKADDPSVESWIAGPLLKALHLKRRYPLVPFSSFLGTHFDSAAPHSQSQRAAALTRALCEFKRDLDYRRLKPDFLGERPNCGHSLTWLFNALREPNVGCDKMMRYAGKEHVAVLRRGHLFKVSLLDGDSIVSYQKLEATYQKIIDLSLDEKHWTGILTTDNRDSWATNRQKLISMDPKNATYIGVLEESIFVMCLDDDSPVTREERVRSGYLGDSFNRWHDKTLQLIVTANGRSGTIFEHSMIDFMTTSQISQRLQGAIDTLDPQEDNLEQNGEAAVDLASLKEIPLGTMPTNIEAHISTLRDKYAAVTGAKIYTPHLIPSFGKALLLAHSVPIKATVDLTIQLASRLYFGYLPASWETVSTAHFHLGRPEIVQVVLKSVVDFCDAALDPAVPRFEACAKLLKAARECNAQIVKGGEGRNYFRLMDVLEVMSQEVQDEDSNETVPELFSDPVWKRSYPRLIMQTMIENKLAQDPGYTMEDPENVWMNYTVNEDSLEVCFVSPRSGAERFRAALDRATGIVKTIIQHKESR